MMPQSLCVRQERKRYYRQPCRHNRHTYTLQEERDIQTYRDMDAWIIANGPSLEIQEFQSPHLITHTHSAVKKSPHRLHLTIGANSEQRRQHKQQRSIQNTRNFPKNNQLLCIGFHFNAKKQPWFQKYQKITNGSNFSTNRNYNFIFASGKQTVCWSATHEPILCIHQRQESAFRIKKSGTKIYLGKQRCPPKVLTRKKLGDHSKRKQHQVDCFSAFQL